MAVHPYQCRHSQENTDHPERLAAIVDGLIATARTMPVVSPLHPRSRAVLQKTGQFEALGRHVNLIEPVGYVDIVQLEKFAALSPPTAAICRKKAFFYQVPCVTLRDETEWTELVRAGWNRLAPPKDADSVLSAAIKQSLGSQGQSVAPYGVGDSATRIASRLVEQAAA